MTEATQKPNDFPPKKIGIHTNTSMENSNPKRVLMNTTVKVRRKREKDTLKGSHVLVSGKESFHYFGRALFDNSIFPNNFQ